MPVWALTHLRLLAGLTLCVAVCLAVWGFGEVCHSQGWHARDGEVAGLKATIASVRAAQVAADKAARANQVAKAAAHAINDKEVTDANSRDHDQADGVVAALRVRIADLDRAARARAVPRAGAAASAADGEVDRRLPLADELALRQQCEAGRLDYNSLIDWEVKRVTIETAPPPG